MCLELVMLVALNPICILLISPGKILSWIYEDRPVIKGLTYGFWTQIIVYIASNHLIRSNHLIDPNHSLHCIRSFDR